MKHQHLFCGQSMCDVGKTGVVRIQLWRMEKCCWLWLSAIAGSLGPSCAAVTKIYWKEYSDHRAAGFSDTESISLRWTSLGHLDNTFSVEN